MSKADDAAAAEDNVKNVSLPLEFSIVNVGDTRLFEVILVFIFQVPDFHRVLQLRLFVSELLCHNVSKDEG